MIVGQFRQRLSTNQSSEKYMAANTTENGRLKDVSRHSPFIEYEIKFKKILKKLYTKKAKEIGVNRLNFMNEFFNRLSMEMEGNETVIKAMQREAKEEINIGIEDNQLEIVQVMHRKCVGHERIDYFFLCNKWDGDVINGPLDWFLDRGYVDLGFIYNEERHFAKMHLVKKDIIMGGKGY